MGDNTDSREHQDAVGRESSDSFEEHGSSHGRKRKPKPHAWRASVVKKLRNEGKAYTSRMTKNLVEARKIGAPCADGCFSKVTMPVVEALFKEFWGMGDYNAQTAYLQKLMTSVPIKRRRKAADESMRTQTILYSVMYGDKKHSICKKGFCSIFGIGQKRVRVAIQKLTMGKTTLPDQRGKTPTATKFVGEKADLVRTHIKMLPTMSSHYSRAKSPYRMYLDSTLSVVKLYDMYVKFMKDQHPDVEVVSFNYYSKVFRSEFNIGFSPPVIDTCNTCDLLKANIQNYRQMGCAQAQLNDMQRELDEHKALAARGRAALDSFITDDSEDIMALCFDLQQTLPTPKLSTSVAFYKRKLWTYNFGIFNLKTKKSTMYVWDEVTARRGSCEIMSCVNHYIEANHEPNQTKLVLFSDNCGGQNKNVNVILGCLRLLHSKKFFRVEHYFLVPGHSYLPCDRHFGNIEKKLRREAMVCTKHDYIDLIERAVQGGFAVINMTQMDFLNFDILQTYITKRTSKTTSMKGARVIVYDVAFMEGYAIKTSYDMADTTDQHQVRLMKGKVKFSRKVFDLYTVPLPLRYASPIPLSTEKLNDLKDLIRYIAPLESVQYFKDIINEQEAGNLHNSPDEVNTAGGEDNADDLDKLLDY